MRWLVISRALSKLPENFNLATGFSVQVRINKFVLSVFHLSFILFLHQVFPAASNVFSVHSQLPWLLLGLFAFFHVFLIQADNCFPRSYLPCKAPRISVSCQCECHIQVLGHFVLLGIVCVALLRSDSLNRAAGQCVTLFPRPRRTMSHFTNVSCLSCIHVVYDLGEGDRDEVPAR